MGAPPLPGLQTPPLAGSAAAFDTPLWRRVLRNANKTHVGVSLLCVSRAEFRLAAGGCRAAVRVLLRRC